MYKYSSLVDFSQLWSIGGNAAGTHIKLFLKSAAESNKFSVTFGNGNIRYDGFPVIGELALIVYTRPASSNHNSGRMFLNGSELTRETSDSDSLNLGNNFTATGGNIAGSAAPDANIYEKITYQEELSTVNRQLIENDLISFYSIT